mmetsp:Transcript_58804/g.143839  ORF Transcript_58804/g.143839 Transcript_58804/m.143839 type:complete len:417 (-) Transcript_58804:247-1497(-)
MMIRPESTAARLNPTTLRSTSSSSSSSEDRHTPKPPIPPTTTMATTTHRIQRFVGPASLVGGTAAIYTSLLQHPSSTLTRLSFVYLMLLAVQYAIQPRLSKRYISSKLNKQSVALVEEVVKTGLAAAVFCSKPSDVVQGAVKDWSISSSLAVAGLPAMLYALQGVLQYVSYQQLDSVTFNGLTQTKTLSAAFCCWLVMGKTQSPLQIVALVILFGSALVFQGYLPQLFGGRKGKQEKEKKKQTIPASTTKETAKSTMPQAKQQQQNDEWVWRGVVPCLGAAFLSGLAGSLSQKGLQLTGISGRDPFLYTVEISFFSAVTLLINMIRSNVFTSMEWQKQRQYWTWETLIPIVVKATGGVITALVHKYAGSVSKGFALMFGLVLSNMIQLSESQDALKDYQIVGTIMIMISTWLHFTH